MIMNEFTKFLNWVFKTETEGKNNDLQRFQILQTFQVQKQIIEGYSFLPKEFPEKCGFKIATTYAGLLSSLPGTLKKI